MYNWTIIDTIYLYDGSIEGLLSLLYECFVKKQIPRQVQEVDQYIENLLDTARIIKTNYEHSTCLVDAISKKLSSASLYYIYTAFLSGDEHKAESILRYVLYAFKHGKQVDFMKSVDCVMEIQRISKNVKGEAHRLTGFLRFHMLSNQFLYAEYESDNDVLVFLAQHFQKRLSQEIWMIHDKGRNRIALYNRKNFIVVDATTVDVHAVERDQDDIYVALWKAYFKNISIKERENRQCQRGFMPKKYWKYLPEV